MVGAIDPTKPADGVPAVKLDLRSNLQAAKTEIEAPQTCRADVGQQHVLGDVTDAGALAGLDQVGAGEIASDALDGRAINMQNRLLTRPEIRDFAETSATPAVTGGIRAVAFGPVAMASAVRHNHCRGRGRHPRVREQERGATWYGYLGGKALS